MHVALKDPVDVLKAFQVTKIHAIHWEDIGRNLGVSRSDRKLIRQEEDCVDNRLEAVLEKWIEREATPQWMTLITALKEVGLLVTSLADSIQQDCINHPDD